MIVAQASARPRTLWRGLAGLVPAIPIHMAKLCAPKRDHRDKPGHDGREVARPRILTLILYDTIPNAVRSARGRSHEASCGWDRMRRPRPGENASPALGRRRELRPAATTSRPPGAWPPGADRPPCASPKMRRPAGTTDGTRKARPGAVRKTPAMARHEAPASLERERGTERTMVAPPGAPSPSPLRGDRKRRRRTRRRKEYGR